MIQNQIQLKSRLKIPITLILFIVASCGVKAPPEPPVLPAPASPGKFEARVREGCVELKWRAPEASEPEDTPASIYEVLKATVLSGQTPAFKIIGRTGHTSMTDCKLGLGQTALYKARGVSAEGRRGAETDPVKASMALPPLAPLHPRTKAGDGFVEIFWETPPDMPKGTTFNVYRATDPSTFPWRPVNVEPIPGNHFADGPLENGISYYYEVHAIVAMEGSPAIEGPAGPLVRAVPADRVPPSPPKGFIAIWVDDGVMLRWLSNSDPDLAGYVAFRRLRGLGTFVELFIDPIKGTEYIDRTARRGTEYEYAVRAVDNSQPPNQSPWSDVQVVYAEP